ncbi:hypothetical protein Q8814_24820, partial [Rhodococcus sp. CC-R104]|nr:hypothetical protein [Rhodococcus sp. CC-R104]
YANWARSRTQLSSARRWKSARTSRAADVVSEAAPRSAMVSSALGRHTGKARLKATTTTRNLKTLRKLT